MGVGAWHLVGIGLWPCLRQVLDCKCEEGMNVNYVIWLEGLYGFLEGCALS